jgi:predicted SprT family Zn-dependent metalloprotease
MDLHDAFALGTRLLEQHGLTGWTLTFDNAKRRAGVCRHGSRLIGLSAPLTRLHAEDEVRETLLHEIAHALAGPEHGHDAVWAATARRIGGNGERCLPADAPQVAAPWLGVCPAGHTKERHRRPERVASCGLCSSSFSVDHVYDWTFHGRPATMHPNYAAELDRLRSGRSVSLMGVGARARVIAPGDFYGRVGTVRKRGRTSYHIEVPEGRLRVLFAGAEPAGRGSR